VWGFPKGRRNINEDDVNCALREFREETNISIKNIKMCNDMKPLEEVFSGTNNVRYKHVYYIAKLNSNFGDTNEYTPCVSSNNIEIKDIRWFDYNEAQSKIRNVNIERKELFKRLNQIVVKTIR
jgi:8-oxo-dGTP pyrophosphatase MutT (NUDIX family)